MSSAYVQDRVHTKLDGVLCIGDEGTRHSGRETVPR